MSILQARRRPVPHVWRLDVCFDRYHWLEIGERSLCRLHVAFMSLRLVLWVQKRHRLRPLASMLAVEPNQALSVLCTRCLRETITAFLLKTRCVVTLSMLWKSVPSHSTDPFSGMVPGLSSKLSTSSTRVFFYHQTNKPKFTQVARENMDESTIGRAHV